MGICEVKGCSDYAARELCPYHGKAVRQGRIEAEPHWYTQPNPPCTIPGCVRVSQSKKQPHICHVHRSQLSKGRDLGTVRPKLPNGGNDGDCSNPHCQEPAAVRGLCYGHYAKSKRGYKWGVCKEEGCERRTPGTLCPAHRPPNETTALQDVECDIPLCGRVFRTLRGTTCPTHRSDRRRKGLSEEQYRDLMQIGACEACGYEGKLVVDHGHGHHEKNAQMCPECIRGRLCNGCNTALGHVGESPDALRGLADYIERFK